MKKNTDEIIQIKKLAEEKNDENQLRLGWSLVENSETGIFIAERKTRRTIYVNPAAAVMFGFSSETRATGKSIENVLGENGRRTLLSHEEILSLKNDCFSHFHVKSLDKYYYIKAKSAIWNGKDAYILYIIDETAQHDRQAQLQNLIDEVPGGIGIYEIIDGKVSLSYLNNAYYAMLGLTREKRMQYYGTNALSATNPDDRKALLEGINRLINGEDRTSMLHRVKNNDGNWVWLNLRAHVVERRDGYLKVYASFGDIDEMIRAQEELHERYEEQIRYTRMISAGSFGSSMVNLTANTITLQNTDDDGIHTIITKQTPQQGFEAMYPNIPDEKIRNEYKKIFDSKTIISDFEKGVTHKSIRHPYMNYLCWLESEYNAVRNPKTGDLEVYCVANDVSEDKLSDDVSTFLMSHSYDEAILINPLTGEPKPLISSGKSPVYNEQTTANDFNKGLENYFLKYSADDDKEKAAQSASLETVTKALEKSGVYTISYSVYDLLHNIIHKRASYSYLNKYKTHLLCTVQDITEAFHKEALSREALKKALDSAEKANQAKSAFLSRMSHDMRTPLNGIIGMSRLARDNDNPADTVDCLDNIDISSEFLLGLINDVLDMERIDSGKTTLNLVPYSGQEFTQYVNAVITPLCKTKNIEFTYSSNAKEDFVVLQDKLRINQIYFNLLSNAVKFTPKGGKITLTTDAQKLEKSVKLITTISDNGIGMSDDFQRHMFEPFSQENQSVLPLGQGTGLGLSIVKKMCDLMGMTLDCHSVLGKGTTFIIHSEFPLATEADLKNATADKTGASSSEVLSGKRVLVCEDHPMNREIIKRLLQKKGMDVVLAENGRIGVEIFAKSDENSFSAVLMDIRMPVLDGLCATREIRNLVRNDAKNVPIIALTANAYDEDIRNCLKAGMNAHLAKPIDADKLYEVLSGFVGDR